MSDPRDTEAALADAYAIAQCPPCLFGHFGPPDDAGACRVCGADLREAGWP